MKSARYLVPFGFAAALFAAILLLLVRHGLHQDAGVFVYPLDDAYIHLAVSRNLALHGVWGITPFGFSGASSSPGWTLLLAGVIRLIGVHLKTPLALNALAGLLLLLAANFILARMLPRAGIAYLTAALCVLVLVVPLPGLAMIGMEHLLHSVAMLCMVAAAAWIVSTPEGAKTPPASIVALLFAAAACGALRYESCFAVAVVVGVLLLRRRIGIALCVAVAAAIGPVAYGLYSHAHTGLWLPFSVMMKSSGHRIASPSDALLLSSVAPILLLVAVAFLLRIAQRMGQPSSQREPFWTYGQSFLAIVLATTFLHAEVGPTGWLMRYEAYLYVLGIVALALALGEGIASCKTSESAPNEASRWLAVAMIVALLPAGIQLMHRAHHGYSDIAASLHDRYVEHLSQALFVSQDEPHAVVIANDIGFLAFYAGETKILDPLGLGSIEPVLQQRAHREIDPVFMQQWGAKSGASFAILHTDFPGMEAMVPAGWVPVESWCFPHNLVFLNHVESFYAPDETSADALRAQLAGFHDLSPEIVRYRFPQDGKTPPLPTRGETAVCPVPPSGTE
jgi:hypothetical protein